MNDERPADPAEPETASEPEAAADAGPDPTARPGEAPDYVPDGPSTYQATADAAGFGPAQGQTPPTAAVPGSKVTRDRTIGLIVAGVVGVGALGALAGLVLGGEGAGTTPAPPASPTDKATAGGQADDAVSIPEAVGATTRGTMRATLGVSFVGAGLTPTSDLTQEEDEEGTGEDTSNGELVFLEPGVDVYVPPGWEVIGQDATAMLEHAGRTYVFAATGVADPASEASAVMQELAPDLMPASTYTQFESSEITPVEPTGSLVSLAFVDYVAVYVDAQSSSPIYGRLIVGIRQDGVLLAMTIESSPPKAFNKEQPDWTTIPGVTYTRFSGG